MSDTPETPASESKEPSAADLALVQPPAKSKLVPIIVAVNTAVMLGVVAFVLIKGSHPAEAAPTSKKKAPVAEGEEADAAEEEPEAEGGGEHGSSKKFGGPTVKLEDFVVRLRNPEADRFARVSFEVEVGNDRDKERLVASMARVRDAFIGELTERTVEELRGTEGLTSVKIALSKKLKDLVPACHVRGLYITDFIVQ
jgi:flagellar FliL protein